MGWLVGIGKVAAIVVGWLLLAVIASYIREWIRKSKGWRI